MAEDKTTAEEQAAAVDLDATLVRPGGFIENPNHTPNPFFQYGTVDTSGLGAPEHQQMAAISPVFEAARAENLRTAARALDPNDPEVSSDLVILPESTVTVQGSARTADDARAEVFGAVRRLVDDPVVLGISPGAQEAARGIAPEDADDKISEEEQVRLDAKERAQADEADRLAATREGSAGSADRASQVAADRAVGSRDIGADSAPVAGSSATPSAATPDKDTKASSAASRRTTSDNSKK
jgi:hypothetical protein